MNDRSTSALVTAVCVWGLVGVFVFDTQPAADAGAAGPLRVATYNVHQWHSGSGDGLANLEEVQHALEQVAPDVVGLQETEGGRLSSSGTDGTRWLAHRLGMHHVQAPAGQSGGYGLALLSRWPVVSSHVLDLPTDGTVARHALFASIAHPDGPLHVAVTHFEIDRYPELRVLQAEALLEHVPEGTFLLLGDFNTYPGEEAYERLRGTLSDAWLEAGREPGTGATSPVPGAEVRIDHIWIRGWDALAAGIFGGPAASDHHGVWADLAPAPAA